MDQGQDGAAKALGMTATQLRTALQGGKSLATIAKDQKVSVDSLVKAMVTATEGELATAVKDGTLTQTRADKIKSSLTQQITKRVNSVRPDRGLGNSPRGSQPPSSVDGNPGGTQSAPSSTT